MKKKGKCKFFTLNYVSTYTHRTFIYIYLPGNYAKKTQTFKQTHSQTKIECKTFELFIIITKLTKQLSFFIIVIFPR